MEQTSFLPPHFNGPDYDPEHDQARLTQQLSRIKQLMVDGVWRTLGEIEAVTGDPQSSISAQLRHLRKKRFGQHLVEKRTRGERSAGLWEYRLGPPGSGVQNDNDEIEETENGPSQTGRRMSILSESSASARHSSESNEWGTPIPVIEAARATLGGFDLDPFSSASFNERVKATLFYSANAWAAPWFGRVFINPPGGFVDAEGRIVIIATKTRRGCGETGACGLPLGHKHEGIESSQKRAWQKLMSEHEAARVPSAIFVCFSVELLQTTQVNPTGRIPLEFPICYPSRRLPYTDETGKPGKSPTHASCIIFVPEGHRGDVERFEQAFKDIGHVVVPRRWS
jgi:hypothetical protein